MASVAVLMMLLQGLLLAPEVSSLSAYTDESHRLRQNQARDDRSSVAKATMDARGRMEVKPRHRHVHHQASGSDTDTETVMLKGMYPFYHTTEEIHKEAIRLSHKCNGALKVKTIQDGNVSLDVVTVRKASAKPQNRVFILFGEHSRELISPESGLYLLRALCGDVELSAPSMPGLLAGFSAADALEDSEFQMVLNANPRSRRKVEGGEFCLRTNPDGVDLNRNWDEQWQSEAAVYGASSSPGPKPFSEPETRIVKRLVTDFLPTTFLTVHSGTRGMYMPWAYDMKHLAHYNEPAMMEILKVLDKDHCQCPFGAAGKEVGYSCPGTCLDYAYAKLNTSFAFAFEIYTSPSADEDLKERWSEKMRSGGAQLLEKGNHLGHPHFRDVFSEHTSDFVDFADMSSVKSGLRVKAQQGAEGVEVQFPDTGCFDLFNPETKDEYDKTVKNWAEAYLQMSSLIAKKIKAGEVAKIPAAGIS